MNLERLNQKLIAAARANPPGDAVPYAFEKRIMARLSGRTVPDIWGMWGQALSRAAAVCVLAMLGLALWSHFGPEPNSETLSQDVERTLFAAVDNSVPGDQLGESE
ncbi:MAG TPA: hypothetical protein VH598_07505 [Verrucomicrobiae bacterium]|nr:hypothetical protein [Verrucomicrobiae bacterium]